MKREQGRRLNEKSARASEQADTLKRIADYMTEHGIETVQELPPEMRDEVLEALQNP